MTSPISSVGSLEAPALEPGSRVSSVAPGVDFGAELSSAIASVDRLHVQADRQAEAIALGGGNLHETALALEKADIAMHLMVKVRNKLVEAYQDVMRMSV